MYGDCRLCWRVVREGAAIQVLSEMGWLVDHNWFLWIVCMVLLTTTGSNITKTSVISEDLNLTVTNFEMLIRQAVRRQHNWHIAYKLLCHHMKSKFKIFCILYSVLHAAFLQRVSVFVRRSDHMQWRWQGEKWRVANYSRCSNACASVVFGVRVCFERTVAWSMYWVMLEWCSTRCRSSSEPCTY